MSYSTNSNKTSAKALMRAIGCIDDLTMAAAEVAAIFHTYQVLIEQTGLPADPQAIEECSQMFATMNRMMLRQKADLQHLQMMQKSMAKSEKVLRNAGSKNKKSNQTAVTA